MSLDAGRGGSWRVSLSVVLSVLVGCGARSALDAGDGALAAGGAGGGGGEGAFLLECPAGGESTLDKVFGEVGPRDTSPEGQLVNARPAVAMGADGRYVVAWTEAGAQLGAYFQRYDAAGARMGGAVRVSPPGTDVTTTPAVAMDANGGFVVVWTRSDTVEVELQRYREDGEALGPVEKVSGIGSDGEAQYVRKPPVVAMAADGAFAVVWLAEAGVASDVSLKLYGPDGSASTSILEVPAPAYVPVVPGIGMNPEGAFVIAWAEQPLEPKIRALSYTSSGFFAAEVADVSGDTLPSVRPPGVGMAPDGTFVVSWVDDEREVVARRLDPQGQALGEVFVVTEETASALETPLGMDDPEPPRQGVAVTESGDFVVSWVASKNGPRLRRYDEAGNPLTGEVAATSGPPLFSNDGAVVAVSQCNGNHVIAWSETEGEFRAQHALYRAE